MKRALLALLLLTASARGQTPPVDPPKPSAPVVPVATISAPASVPPGTPLVLFADGSVSKSPLNWVLISPKGSAFSVYSSPTLAGAVLIVPAPTPGVTYKFAMVASGDAPPFAFDFAEVPVQAATPPIPPSPPGPFPDPTPTPPPEPGFTGHLHSVLVFDVDEPSTAQLRASTIKADAKTLDSEWYVAPSVGATAQLFAKYTAADGVPTVYFMDDAGKIIDRLKSPTTKDQVLAKLKTIRGAR